MAKVRKIPAAYEGTRGVPAQYTTDPDVATPEQVAAIGTAIDKARKLVQGRVIGDPLLRGKPVANAPTRINISRGAGAAARQTPNAGLGGGRIATSPTRVNRSGGNQSLYPEAPNTSFTSGNAPAVGNIRTAPSAGGSIANAPAALNASVRDNKSAGSAFNAGLRGGQGTLRIQPNIEQLAPSEAAALKMLESSLIAREIVARVREEVGPVASFQRCLVVARLPKTRSGKVLRATMRALADGRAFETPATIEDPAVIEEIRVALQPPG